MNDSQTERNNIFQNKNYSLSRLEISDEKNCKQSSPKSQSNKEMLDNSDSFYKKSEQSNNQRNARSNLFNSKSTSRERIQTKKKTFRKEQQNNQEVLKDFPFLSIAAMDQFQEQQKQLDLNNKQKQSNEYFELPSIAKVSESELGSINNAYQDISFQQNNLNTNFNALNENQFNKTHKVKALNSTKNQTSNKDTINNQIYFNTISFEDQQDHDKSSMKQTYNHKQEREKTQIMQQIITSILYENVIPQQVKQIAKETQSQVKHNKKKNKQSITTNQLEEFFDNRLLKSVLIKFLQDFCNVTENTKVCNKALMSYIEDELIENVNFALCSQIWNDCLLIPKLMNDNPHQVINNMLQDMATEVAKECIDQQQSVTQNGSMNESEEQEEMQEVQRYNSIQDLELWDYIEEKIVEDQIYENVEDIAIHVIQQVIFENKQHQEQIVQDIFNNLLRSEVKSICVQVQRKQRVLNKGSDNFLSIFMKQFIQEIVNETSSEQQLHTNSDNQMPQNYETESHSQNYTLDNEQTMFEQEEPIIGKITESILFNLQSEMLTEIILESINIEQDIQNQQDMIQDQVQTNEIKIIVQESIEEEIFGEIIDYMIDKITEESIWRSTVKDIKQEDIATQGLLNEIFDQETTSFFNDHFQQIKNEYLKLYKESIESKEKQQFKILKNEQESQSPNNANDVNSPDDTVIIDQIKNIGEQHSQGNNNDGKNNSINLDNYQCSHNNSQEEISQQQDQSRNYQPEETLSNFYDIDEGEKQASLIKDYYVIPKIKTVDFLNISFNDFIYKAKNNSNHKAKMNEDKVLPVDAQAIEVLCVNCYECIKVNDVDEHSTNCEKVIDLVKQNQYQRSYSHQVQSNKKRERMVYNEEEFEIGKEQKEMINEINQKIFKLHKAIKNKQNEIEEEKQSDYEYMRILDEIEQQAVNIFTNNTNNIELEVNVSELIQKIKKFKPDNANELSLNITARRLVQLSLQKIDYIDEYQQIVQDDEICTPIEKMSNYDSDGENNEDKRVQSNITKQLSPFSNNFNEQETQSQNDQKYKDLEEETNQNKAELEVWRNLHNEMLKNYLNSKGVPNSRCINEINSEISGNSNPLSEGLSSATSFNAANISISGLQSAKKSNYMLNSENDVAQLDEVEESLKHKQNEDLKRYFYTIAIHNSKKILKTIPQGTTLKQLYNKCIEQNIAVGEWDQFLQKELKAQHSGK